MNMGINSHCRRTGGRTRGRGDVGAHDNAVGKGVYLIAGYVRGGRGEVKRRFGKAGQK